MTVRTRTVASSPLTARIAAPAGIILVLLCIAQFLDGMDISSMGVVLPDIQHSLHMSAQSLQWIVSGYVLGYGGFLLLGGRIADLFGRRRTFVWSMSAFAIAGLAGAMADSGAVLIAARIAKGIFAGFTGPAALSLLLGLYSEPAKRNHALGIFSAIGAIGFALGQVLGGVLGDISWRLTLLLPTLVAAMVTVAGILLLQKDSPKVGGNHHFDLPGAFLATLSPLAIVYGATNAVTHGWVSSATYIPIAIGVLLAGLFIRREIRTDVPLMPLEVFKGSGLAYGSIMAFLMQGNYVAFQFIASLFYQQVAGWSATQTGVAFALGGACVVFGAPRAAKLALRLGPVRLIVAGLALQAAGYAFWYLMAGRLIPIYVAVGQGLLTGAGFALAFPSVNIKSLVKTREADHGIASGIIFSAFQIGSGIILAVVASTFAALRQTGADKYRMAMLLVTAMATVAALGSLAGWSSERKEKEAVVAGEAEPA